MLRYATRVLTIQNVRPDPTLPSVRRVVRDATYTLRMFECSVMFRSCRSALLSRWHRALIKCGEAGRAEALMEVGMVARGRVRNGVVVLDDGVRLPEGQEVMILAPATPLQEARPQGILDIPPVSVGGVLRPFTTADDLLGDMLEGRS